MGKTKRKFSQSQYDMLKRCSDKKDMTEWNQWRKNNPDEDVLLEKADLKRFYLEGAKLWEVNLKGAKLQESNLQGDNISEANLHGAVLWQANLYGAYLYKANLQGADLRWADLQSANLCWADLQSANLFQANLKGAELKWANLQGAALWDADLQGAKLQESNLQGADLREADLNRANLQFVKFDSRTRCSSLKNKDFYGSPVFKRLVEDTDYLEDFKRRHPVIYWIWFVLSDCGRSIKLWALWSLAFAVFFAHVFYSLGPEYLEVADMPWNFSTAFYYSMFTFTTLGFGVPKTNAAAWWVLAEVITGYVMLGGLISIFANKLARRR
jgi:uncharacterized protein YjbI with pentapeptide repeats